MVSVQKFQSQVAVAALLLRSLLFILIVTVYFRGCGGYWSRGWWAVLAGGGCIFNVSFRFALCCRYLS